MKFVYKIFYLSVAILVFVTSCSKKPVIETTSTYKMAGEWYTRYYTGGAAITPFHKIITYNVSDPAANQIWVDDLGTWPFKSKFNVDIATLSFPAMATTPNLKATGETVKVIEGKVLPKVGHTKTGTLVDSIFLKLEFSDDPGTIYEVRGHMRTGFFEDEY